MNDDTPNSRGRFFLSVGVGLTLWGFSLAWYLYCRKNGSIYGLPFLLFAAPGVPGGFVGYWVFRIFGGAGSPLLFTVCELALPSLSICLSWTFLSYQLLTRFTLVENETRKSSYRGLLLALIPFVLGWAAIPFIIGRLTS